MAEIQLELTTPERVVLEQTVRQISLPTTEGEITILENHVPLLTPLQAGEMRVLDSTGQEKLLAVAGGFVVVHPGNRVTVLADSAEPAEELDIEAIEKAKEAAEKALEEGNDDQERFADLQAGLLRDLARLRVARKHKSRRPGPNSSH